MKLEDFLNQKQVWFKLIDKPETIHTSDASQVTGIDLKQITKSLVFKADGLPILAVIPGNKKIDIVKLTKAVAAEKVNIAPFDEAERFSGYPPGATPPVNHTNITKIVFDSSLLQFRTIFGGGGSRNKLLEISVKDALRLTGGLVTDISI